MKPGYYVCETEEDCGVVEHLYEEVNEQVLSGSNYLDSSSNEPNGQAANYLDSSANEQAANYLDSSANEQAANYLDSSANEQANDLAGSNGQPANYLDASDEGVNYLGSSHGSVAGGNYEEVDSDGYKADGYKAGNYAGSDVSVSGNYEDASTSGTYGYGVDVGDDVESSGGNYEELKPNKPPVVKKKPAPAAPKKAVVAVDLGRDWHAEFLALLDRRVSTPLERLQRYVELQALSSEFASEATKRAKIIVHELHLPLHAKTIRPIDAGGIAGGIKFMNSRIFFKFTLDHEGLYSGDEFAAKAAGRELNGLESYLSFILDTGSKLRTAMQVLIDYAGYRVIACSLLPIGANTLVYGSNDAGRSVHADEVRMNALMREAGMWLNLKPHLVAGTEIYAPADVEGHVGKDNNYYVLDTARVFPPEQPPRYFSCLIVPARDIVTSVDLLTNGFDGMLQEIVGSSNLTSHAFSLGRVFFCTDENLPLNERCSKLSGKPCRGLAVIVPNGYKGKFLYNLLRREFVQSYPIPLSSDAFSGFGRHKFREHNDEVAEASNVLRTRVLEEFCSSFFDEKRSIFIASGSDLTDVLHRKGIPLRMLGLIWVRISVGRAKHAVIDIILAEMVTRAAKQLIRMRMREAKDGRAVVLQTLNNLLGGRSPENDQFWELTMQIQMRSKYGCYAGVFSKNEQFENVRKSTNMDLLYKRLMFVLGLECNVKLNYTFLEYNCPAVPFPPDCELKLDARVKTLVASKVKEGFELALKENVTVKENKERKIMRYAQVVSKVEHLEAVVATCAPESSMRYLFRAQLAVGLVNVRRFDEAKGHCLAIITSRVPLSLALRIVACIWFCKAESDSSLKLKILLGARKAMGSSSLSLLVLEMLCAELLLGGKLIAARKIGMEFKVRSEQFPIARLPNDDMIAVFGRFPSVLPFCEKNYDYTVPEKRIKEFYRRMMVVLNRPALLFDSVLDLLAPFDLNSELEEIDIHCTQFNMSQYAFSSLWSGLHDLLHFKRPIEGTRFAINVVEMVNNEKDTGFYAVSPLWAESNVLASHRLASLVLPKSRGSGFLDVARTSVVNLPESIGSYSQYHFLAKGRCIGLSANGVLKERRLDDDLEKISETSLVCPINTVFTQLRGGSNYCAALTDKGELFTFGGNDADSNDQLGHGDGAMQHHPKAVQIAQKVSKIACTENFMVALTVNADLYCWGRIDSSTVWNYPVKLSKSFTPLEVSCGSAGVVALASDGKVHCLFVDRTHNAKVSAHFAVVEELHDIVMCQVTCGSSVLMLSQQDGEVYCISSSSTPEMVPESFFDMFSSRVDLIGSAKGLRMGMINEPCASVMCEGELCAAISCTGKLYLWGGSLSVLSIAMTGVEQVISMHGSVIVCKASDEIVSLVRPTTIAITSPPESREFRLVHIPVQPDRPGYVLADEIVQMRVDLPADCRASSFQIRTSCSTTKYNLRLDSKTRPCSVTASFQLFHTNDAHSEVHEVFLTFDDDRCKTKLASMKLTLLSPVEMEKVVPACVELIIVSGYRNLVYFSNLPSFQSNGYFVLTSTLDGKWISAKQLDKASTIHEESVGNFKSGSFLIDLCFVMTSVYAIRNVRELKESDFVKLRHLGKVSLTEEKQAVAEISEKGYDIYLKHSKKTLMERYPNLLTIKVSCVEGFVYHPPKSAVCSGLNLVIDASQLSEVESCAVLISLCKAPIQFSAVTVGMIQVEKGVQEWKCPDYHLDGSLSKLYLVVCCDGLCFQTVEVPVFETEAQVCQFLESQGREVPEKYKPRSACDFGCSLVDPDVLYVYPGHQLPVDWHMDLKIGYPNTHMVYVFFKGDHDVTKIKSCGQCTNNPALIYIPNLPNDTELDLVCGFMDEKTFSYSFSSPARVIVAADERDARAKNRKWLEAKNPKPVSDVVAAAPLFQSDEDLDLVAKVISMLPIGDQKHVRTHVEQFGKHLMTASYSVLRSAGLEPEKARYRDCGKKLWFVLTRVASALISAREKYRVMMLGKLTWQKVLGSEVLSKDQFSALDSLLDASLFRFLDAQLLTDCQIPIVLHPLILGLVAEATGKWMGKN